MHSLPLQELAALAETAAQRAAHVIQQHPPGSFSVETKQGGASHASQVVTKVDRLAQSAILEVLDTSCQDYDLGLLTEEREDDLSRLDKVAFWCIDPLDGTLPFTENTPGYSVSIGLVRQDGTPLIGVINDPVSNGMVTGVKEQGCRYSGTFSSLPAAEGRLGLFTDRSFADNPWYEDCLAFLEAEAHHRNLQGVHVTRDAGAVINALRVVHHPSACYFKPPKPRRSGGSLWDYAATTCVAHETGIIATDIHGRPIELNRPDDTFLNHRGVLFASDASLAEAIRAWCAER